MAILKEKWGPDALPVTKALFDLIGRLGHELEASYSEKPTSTQVAAAANSPTRQLSLKAKEIDGRWGYVNRKGAIIIAPQFDFADDFENGAARVRWGFGSGMRYGLIDTQGRILAKPIYSEMDVFSEGLARVIHDGLSGFIDRQGIEVVPPRYDAVSDFSRGRAAVRRRRNEGFIDPTGAEIIPCLFSSGEDFSDDWTTVQVNRSTGWVEFRVDRFGRLKLKDHNRHGS